ncbi:MAG: polysaccharide biosynthesis tyrosine autokinase [Chloroflexi bacterium]|nr:polysaccharide biosynthesis tyrosine autokinase [Chloroflexota bacterium]MDA1219320.1 polysaccharide biosynthesis tyrosine autokinase [Chloroflexota bacterium]
MSDETIDLRGYVELLLRRWWLILLITIFAVLAALFFSLRIAPASPAPALDYPANTVVHLEGVEGLAWIPELAASRPVLADVIDDLGLPLTVGDLKAKVTAFRIGSSYLVNISVLDPDPSVAIIIANGVAQSYIDYISVVRESSVASNPGYVISSLSDLEATSSDRIIAEALSDLGSLRPYIISPAETVDVADLGEVALPSSNTSPNLFLAGFLGIVLSVLLIIGGEFIQNPVRSPSQFDRKFALTRLGISPRYSKRRNQPYPLPVSDGTAPAAAEAIRQLATSVAGVIGKPGIKTLAIVSPASKDGRSSLAANLGVALAGGWKNVVLLDADLRCPSLHSYFYADNEVGLSSFLTNPDLEVDQIIQETSYQRLKIVPSGPIPANPVELLSSPRMRWLIDHLKDTADVVLVDTPPLLAVTDGTVVSSQVESVVLLVNGPNCRTETIRTATSYLEKVGASILGYVWNGRNSGMLGIYSQASRYQRRSGQGAMDTTPLEATNLVAEPKS